MDNGGVTIENGVCHKDTVNGGHDVWSCENGSSSSSADHLVVMIHGILGSATDWNFGAEQFVKMLPDKVYVHCSERNGATLTLDGVDVMGQRLAEEVLEIIRFKPELRKISFIAHSVGGLVARYAIGVLYQPYRSGRSKDSSDSIARQNIRGTIGGLEAVNFITVATPHLGSRGHKQVPFLFGMTSLEKVAGCVIHLIFRRTGRHLFLTDNEVAGKPPLVKRMVEDNSEYCFLSALRAFKRRVAYSNVGYDHIVGWRTSCIRHTSELPKWEDSLNEKYPHVVYEEYCEAREPNETTIEKDRISDKIEEELVTGLSRVSWEKVDVSFHTSRARFAAHSAIQVKDHYMHAEGADVIQHMIDHFVV